MSRQQRGKQTMRVFETSQMFTPDFDRRLFLKLAGAVTVPLLGGAAPAMAAVPLDLAAVCRKVERHSGGRYGLAVHDTASGRRFNWRGDERFAMASTYKMLLVTAVLAKVDGGAERLERVIPVTAGDVVPNSPFTNSRVGGSVTVGELCEATMIFSDNAAANLLLPAVGGPAALTAFLRKTGDKVTRLDRNEPMMSEDLPGDIRDTSSPDAMLASMERVLAGPVLKPASRQRLIGWMMANTTGDTRLRAGLSNGWRIGDKTGSSSANSANDIAIIWPPGAARPVFVVSFLNRPKSAYETMGVHHADVARAIVTALAV
jgi:beta-lactamase class A